MEHIKAFFHKHPIESVLLGSVAVIALYLALKPAPAAASGDSGEADLQNAYFQAESIQAQSNAAVQVAGITTSAQTAQTQIAATTSVANNTIFANEDEAVTDSNNQAAVSALPYQTEDDIIGALSGVAGQTVTTTNNKAGGGGFSLFGLGSIGGSGPSSSTTTTPTDAATAAGEYLAELSNGLFASNG